jgi:high-affinity iron transporter
MEAVIFVGGVSLGQPAASIPIAAVVGIICGIVIGFIIYEFASRTSKPLNLTSRKTNLMMGYFQP